jgi:N-acetylmuramoyl-L-alanine amidase
MPPVREHCFIIDPGHGGIDGGATSCTGKLESAFNLEISLRLRDMLHFLGYETKMTRSTDISIYTEGETIAQKKLSDLKARVRICEETDGAVLLSIHQNTFSDSRYFGAQVFYSKSGDSENLAKLLQTGFVSTINPGSRRNAKKSEGIYLMDHISCTGVLIECGFLSNPQEAHRLSSKSYQQQICSVIAATLSQYLSNT